MSSCRHSWVGPRGYSSSGWTISLSARPDNPKLLSVAFFKASMLFWTKIAKFSTSFRLFSSKIPTYNGSLLDLFILPYNFWDQKISSPYNNYIVGKWTSCKGRLETSLNAVCTSLLLPIRTLVRPMGTRTRKLSGILGTVVSRK